VDETVFKHGTKATTLHKLLNYDSKVTVESVPYR